MPVVSVVDRRKAGYLIHVLAVRWCFYHPTRWVVFATTDPSPRVFSIRFGQPVPFMRGTIFASGHEMGPGPHVQILYLYEITPDSMYSTVFSTTRVSRLEDPVEEYTL